MYDWKSLFFSYYHCHTRLFAFYPPLNVNVTIQLITFSHQLFYPSCKIFIPEISGLLGERDDQVFSTHSEKLDNGPFSNWISGILTLASRLTCRKEKRACFETPFSSTRSYSMVTKDSENYRKMPHKSPECRLTTMATNELSCQIWESGNGSSECVSHVVKKPWFT